MMALIINAMLLGVALSAVLCGKVNKMDDHTMMVALHVLFEAWEKYKPKKTKEQIYDELAEMLSLVAEEQGAFEHDA